MKWKRLNRSFHRDLGYFCIGLTLIYGISGIAVNHISHSFNPSYNIETEVATAPPLSEGKQPDMEYIDKVLESLGEKGSLKSAALIAPGKMRIFVENNTIDLELKSGKVAMERVTRRPLLYEANFLHLNKGKGIWTWFADLYGAALLILALTGLFMMPVKSKKRALILVMAGSLLPVFYLISIS